MGFGVKVTDNGKLHIQIFNLFVLLLHLVLLLKDTISGLNSGIHQPQESLHNQPFDISQNISVFE